MQYLDPHKLLLLLEDLIEQGKSASEIFIHLHTNKINSFTNREWTMPALQHALLTMKRPEHRSASLVAKLLADRKVMS